MPRLADNSTFRVNGVKELQNLFAQLPKQVNNTRVWNNIWRTNSKPLVETAQALVPKRTGQLERSLGFFTTRASRKNRGGYVGPRIRGAFAKRDESGKYSKSGFYGAFVEHGNFGGTGTGTPHPFMKPAYGMTKDVMLRGSLTAAKKVLEREARRLAKYGTLGY